MRHFPILVLLIAGLAGPADAAQPNWLGGLFVPPHRAAPHRAAHAAPIKPAAAAPAKPAAAPADVPPMPLPRPRPEQRAAETPVVPAAAPATPAAAAPAAAPPASPAGPQSTAPVPVPAAEGEPTTPAPPRVYQTACPAVISGLVEATALPPIADGRCQEQSPLSVTSILVNGRMLKLSAPAIFNCEMATDFPQWVAEVDTYIETLQKTRIKSVLVGGSYECRPRNVEGGSSDLSEHGRADAMDFVGFTLEDGRQLSVTNDFNSADARISRLMHFAHDAACTRFTTVLGPDANALHHDHFHLDLGCHGKTCTYRLCE